MSNLHTPPADWLAELFEFEWCAECGRGAAGHTAVPFMGNWFGRCDHAPQFDGEGELIMNPGGEPDGPRAEAA